MERDRAPSTQMGRGGVRTAAEILPEVLAIIEAEPLRWPNIRSGPREEIPRPVRIAVARRDGRCCRICHRDVGDEVYELDHITPWSAGGSDATTNLRVLCSWCNQRRSNYRDNEHRGCAMVCTWWCSDCWNEDHHPRRRRPIDVSPLLDEAPFVYEADAIAFCAHCGHIGLTNAPLTF